MLNLGVSRHLAGSEGDRGKPAKIGHAGRENYGRQRARDVIRDEGGYCGFMDKDAVEYAYVSGGVCDVDAATIAL
jgi:hypothetical protein